MKPIVVLRSDRREAGRNNLYESSIGKPERRSRLRRRDGDRLSRGRAVTDFEIGCPLVVRNRGPLHAGNFLRAQLYRRSRRSPSAYGY
jgi:hypothetical protein